MSAQVKPPGKGAFDPYHIRLGIPPQSQPPHHYCLLGIGLFEQSADVICNAADQRMAHLRTFQTGPNALHSQKLLNEVAAARVCLLNPEKRAAYDESLRRKLTPRKERPPRQIATMTGVVVVACIGGLAAVWLWMQPPPSAPRQESSAAAPVAPGVEPPPADQWPTAGAREGPAPCAASTQQPLPGSQPARTQPEPAVSDLASAAPNSFDKLAGPETKVTGGPSRLLPPKEEQPAPVQPEKKPPPAAAVEEPSEPPPPKRKEKLLPPSAESQKRLLASLNEEYGLTSPRSAAEKLGRANALFRMSGRFEERPEEQFVVMNKVAELAGEGGDAVLMLAAIDAANAQFKVDGLTAKERLLKKFAEGATTAPHPLLRARLSTGDRAGGGRKTIRRGIGACGDGMWPVPEGPGQGVS